jgi:hypothetical protein
MRDRQPALQPLEAQSAAFDVYVIERQGGDFRNAAAMPEGQQQNAAVALFVPAGFGRASTSRSVRCLRSVFPVFAVSLILSRVTSTLKLQSLRSRSREH